MNDGSAFPFVMLGLGLLGLHDLGEFGLRWALVDVVWATLAGIALGIISGSALARLGWKLRSAPHEHKLMDDFLGLGLIGVVYGLSVLVNAWGFLAVFFAAVSLRQTELKLASEDRDSMNQSRTDRILPEAANANADDEPPSTVSGGSLVFKEHLERLSELMLVLLVGGTLFLDSWSWRAVELALFLFLAARPISVLAGLLGTRTSRPIRGMVGWFGVRGIGSLYYLMYAIQHGLPEDMALELIQLTLIAVSLSILVHGISVKPLMSRFWHRRKRMPTP
jgi:NhaP-type Na+/H+ or K+/H+ antiporter